MMIFLHKKGWGVETNPDHVEPPTIPLVKETSTSNSDGDYFKLNLCRDPTSSTLDLYEFRISLFDHGEMEESWERLKRNLGYNIFLQLSLGNHYVSLTWCLMTQKIQKPY